MDNLVYLIEQTDRTTPPGCYALRRILAETGVSIDTIRARVAHQAFGGEPPEAFWPPMRALLDQFATELGNLVCGGLDVDDAYELFWEPDTRERKSWSRLRQAERVQVAGAQGTAAEDIQREN
jgi:hypothetical protein